MRHVRIHFRVVRVQSSMAGCENLRKFVDEPHMNSIKRTLRKYPTSVQQGEFSIMHYCRSKNPWGHSIVLRLSRTIKSFTIRLNRRSAPLDYRKDGWRSLVMIICLSVAPALTSRFFGLRRTPYMMSAVFYQSYDRIGVTPLKSFVDCFQSEKLNGKVLIINALVQI